MSRAILYTIVFVFCIWHPVANAAEPLRHTVAQTAGSPDASAATGLQRVVPGIVKYEVPPADKNTTYAAPRRIAHRDADSVILLFIEALLAGLLAVFTPYVYTIHPFTTAYLRRNVKSPRERLIRSLIYAATLVVVFTLLGMLVAVIIKFTGLHKLTSHWIFNLFFFRIFLMLGISFLGAFAIKLPAKWVNSIADKADFNSAKGIIFMAATLPVASFSSTFPIVGLVLLLAGNVSIIGPAIGLFGFGIGLGLPFVFPRMLSIFVKSKSLLNSVKVVMGFLSLMIALKFASNTDVALGYGLIERDMFILLWMGLWAALGIYMLGFVQFSNDTASEYNVYGQEYTSLLRLFIAIGSLVFAFYLLPGIWAAPLPAVSGFLPVQ